MIVLAATVATAASDEIRTERIHVTAPELHRASTAHDDGTGRANDAWHLTTTPYGE